MNIFLADYLPVSVFSQIVVTVFRLETLVHCICDTSIEKTSLTTFITIRFWAVNNLLLGKLVKSGVIVVSSPCTYQVRIRRYLSSQNCTFNSTSRSKWPTRTTLTLILNISDSLMFPFPPIFGFVSLSCWQCPVCAFAKGDCFNPCLLWTRVTNW